jgi:hypothetical protein
MEEYCSRDCHCIRKLMVLLNMARVYYSTSNAILLLYGLVNSNSNRATIMSESI